MSVITPERIAELERLEAAATAGPWSSNGVQPNFYVVKHVWHDDQGRRWTRFLAECQDSGSSKDTAENAAFIAAARNEMRPLLAALREAETQRDAAIARAEKAERRDKNARELLRLEREITGSFTIENAALRARVTELAEALGMLGAHACCPKDEDDAVAFRAASGLASDALKRGALDLTAASAAKAVASNGEGRDAG